MILKELQDGATVAVGWGIAVIVGGANVGVMVGLAVGLGTIT